MASYTFTLEDPDTVSGIAALNVMDAGEDGMPIVFIHGLGADHYEFIHQFRYFSAGRRCVAFDQRGFGRSPATPNMGIERSVADLETLADDMGLDRFVLLGHSLGSMVAFEYTHRHPDRVEKLVIASGSPSLRESRVTYAGLKLIPVIGPFMEDRQRSTFSNVFGFNFGTFGMRTSPDVLRYYFKESPYAFSDKFFQSVLVYMHDLAAFDFRPRLNQLSCPTLVTHGLLDMSINALPSLLAARKIPNVQIRVFPTCGHSPNIEAPAEFNTVLDNFIGLAEGAGDDN